MAFPYQFSEQVHIGLVIEFLKVFFFVKVYRAMVSFLV